MDQENMSTRDSNLTKIPWEEGALGNFEKILGEIPAPIRGIAESRVSKKAESLTQEDGRGIIIEKDMVGAFFAETPGGFLGPMTLSMEELKIDYKQYGFE